jgi:hypothetical protein
MITSPEYDHDFIKFWLGLGNEIYFHLRLTGGSDNDIYIHYLKNFLPTAYYRSPDLKNPIGAGIYNVGCVANHELISAAYMGCNPIYLVGVNFGYPMKKWHVNPLIFSGGKWIHSNYSQDQPDEDQTKRQFISDNGVLTDETNIMYKHATIISWARLKADVYEASVKNLWGILDLLPKADMRKVADGTALLERVPRVERENRINKYREKHGYQPIPWSQGEILIPREDGTALTE